MTLLSVPVWVWLAWQLSLPFNQYTFRSWEALLSIRGSSSVFYPGQQLSMTEVGDLGAYTENALPHPAEWKTDHLGYRNSEPVCEQPDAVVIGDSMAAGASLSQVDTLTEQLSRDTGKCVRSFAGGKLYASLDRIYSEGLHPRWLIIVLAERNTHVLEELQKFPVRFRFAWLDWLPSRLSTLWMHFRKGMYSYYRASHGIAAAVERSFTPPEKAVPVFAPRVQDPAAPPAKMLFFGGIGNANDDAAALGGLREEVNQFAERAKGLGAQLVVTFVPNKETLYPQLAGVPESHLGERIAQSFVSGHFVYVDLIAKFKSAYAADPIPLHQWDDSHWNARGVHLLAEQLAPHLRSGH